jgi:hypothetical protein
VQAETQKLIGQWQLSWLGDPNITEPNINAIVIFASNGKLYILDPTQKTAIVADYFVSNDDGKIYLNVL